MTRLHRIALASTVALCAAMPVAEAKDLTVGFTLDADTLDPANHRKRETETIIRNLYDGIVTRDANMQVVPEIAESMTQVSPTEYDFKIREGIKFHDGTEMTAEDVKFSLDRITVDGAMGDGQTSPRQGLMGPVDKVEVIDGTTVRITLKEPWPILPAMLPNQQIVSKAFVERVGTAGLATEVNGTGPFKLVEWRKGDAIIMERFDDYYGGATDIAPVGPACVDRVIFKVIPESASRVAALLAGDVDIINDLPAFSVAQVKNAPDTDVLTVNGTRSFFIAMNMEGEIFDDPKVRQAAAHAIDKQLIIDKILAGNAASIDGILSPDAFGASELPAYEYDPEKAAALLAEAGFPDGIDVTMDVEGAFKDTAEAVASLLTKAGIRTRVAVGESAQLTEKWRTEGEPKSGDMYFTSWGNGSLDPFDIFTPTHRSHDRGNSAGYANPELDKILDAAAVEMDAEARAAMYREAELIVNADAPYVYLWVPQDIYGVSKRLSGWTPSADSRINLHDACVE
ncbi:ABC transporter substrate-binding protein [Frigidibacter albus]|uniref:ABC transporter substrate-binding protein n=1 Tax=Frigidibacter albus TaxID=1465486 RepID=A0A6L8VLF8_9RHOB|nr:ABC transporter substrate-binding protein [Frigidibacter albus]MZQ91198.1 ABC transporter substrate-binding protein [Frigidibacter albus]NBE33125.1 ABC transporter substrate-binding protein [Frigidibacter albus]GGH63319.1 ABC transporter substrate-binding protein [Frigidibacter albus]